MKVVQINATYGVGSTGNIVKDIHEYLLKNGIESYAFWATAIRKDLSVSNEVFRIGTTLDHKIHSVLRRLFKNQGWNSRFATARLCKKLKKIKPDVVHLHNLHSNFINLPMLLKFLAEENISVAVTMHDCWLFTGYCTHFTKLSCEQWKNGCCNDCPIFKGKTLKSNVNNFYYTKKELFSNIKKLAVIGVSDWITDCSKQSSLKNAYIHKRIYNWIDTDVFYPQNKDKEIREKYSIKANESIILGVSQGWSETKGLKEFKMLSEELSGKAKILLVGDHNGLNSTENLIFVGYTANQKELIELYSTADVFVNPSRTETFGKVTAEAMACGTPVVAYDNTGTSELIDGNSGILVEDGNASELITAVKKILKEEKEKYSAYCVERVNASFNKDVLLSEHLKIYQELSNIKGGANRAYGLSQS